MYLSVLGHCKHVFLIRDWCSVVEDWVFVADALHFTVFSWSTQKIVSAKKRASPLATLPTMASNILYPRALHMAAWPGPEEAGWNTQQSPHSWQTPHWVRQAWREHQIHHFRKLIKTSFSRQGIKHEGQPWYCCQDQSSHHHKHKMLKYSELAAGRRVAGLTNMVYPAEVGCQRFINTSRPRPRKGMYRGETPTKGITEESEKGS